MSGGPDKEPERPREVQCPLLGVLRILHASRDAKNDTGDKQLNVRLVHCVNPMGVPALGVHRWIGQPCRQGAGSVLGGDEG